MPMFRTLILCKLLLLSFVATFAFLSSGCGMLALPPLVYDESLPTGDIVIRNSTTQPVTSVAITECRNQMYGRNRLPGGVSIMPGEERTFRVNVGCWRIALDANGLTARGQLDVEEDGVFYDFRATNQGR